MKLGIVNDFHPEQRAGGASRAVHLFLKERPDARDLTKDEIVFCTPGQLDTTCDAYVVFLAKRFSFPEMSHIQTKPFVWCGFDWWPDEDGNSHWRNLFVEKARLAIFVSPLHQQRFCDIYNVLPKNSRILAPPLDLQRLQAAKQAVAEEERNDRAAWASEWHTYKGPDLAAVLARRLQLHMDMFSPSMPADVRSQKSVFTPFAHPAGFVEDANWYETLARYKALIHTPRVPDAFGYIVLEANALGLDVYLAGRSGVDSFRQPFAQTLELCGASAAQFWQIVERAL